MSIILNKTIKCSINGEVSVKENCLFCFLPNKIKFVKTIDGYNYLKEFDCDNSLDLIDVEVL